MDSHFNISTLTQDQFLKTTLINTFSTNKNIKFSENIAPINLVIFDNANKEKLNKIIKQNPNLTIINTSKIKLQTPNIPLQKPFKINELLSLINKTLEKTINENIIKLSDCEIDTHKRVIKKNKSILENLTEREVEIIDYLNKNKKTTKQILLEKVWNYSKLTQTKVVESNIYKLRQKFKNHNLKNPILYKDGVYKLNK